MNLLASPADVIHVHLLLNHVPTVGTVVAVALLAVALARRNEELVKAGLECLFVVALLTLPAYVSGGAAKQTLTTDNPLQASVVAAHHNAALVAFLWMQLTGAVAWLGLWRLKRLGRTPHATVGMALVLSLVTLVVMGTAANLGGGIRHPEVVPTGVTGAVSSLVDAAALGRFFIEHLWVWPTAESLHLLGLSLAFGVLLVVHLQQLGILKNLSDAAVHQLLPWGMLGVGVNVLTGMLFFTGVTEQYTENPTFHWKIVLLVLAGLNFLYVTTAGPGRRDASRTIDKFIAVSSLAVWVGVLYLGRMLPYLRGSF